MPTRESPARRAASLRPCLRFPTEQERAFRDFFIDTHLNQIRVALVAGLLIYTAFGLLDLTLLPAHGPRLAALRLGLGCPLLAACLALTYAEAGRQRYHVVATATSLCISATLLAVLALAPPPASSTYYAGLLLVIFYSATFIRLNCLHTVLAIWLPFAGYVLVATRIQHLPPDLLLNNLFHFAGAGLIAMLAGFFIENRSRQSFLYLQLLEREMAHTAKANHDLSRELAVRSENERRLMDSERQLRAIFDAVDAALFIHRLDGTIEQVNAKMLEMYETDPEHVIGATADQDPAHGDNPPSEQVREIFRRAAEGQPQRFEWTSRRHRSGETLRVEVSLQPVMLGERRRVLATAHDISERKRAEDLRRDMERISRHDLKGPLGVVVSLPGVLLEDMPDLPPRHAALLRRIEEAGYRMLDMVNESLDMYRLEQGTYDLRPERVDLAAVARKVLEENEHAAENAGLELLLSIDGAPDDGLRGAEVGGEELMLFAMLSNMVRNAVEASPDGGQVRVDLAREQDRVRVAVTNEGEVPGDMKDVFFEKFATSGKVGGTGLGTYSMRLIAEVHGGSVELDASEPGMTRVVASLPARPGPRKD